MFITLEGIEGSGKSTLAKSLSEKIKHELKKESVLTREPGGTIFGQNIRSLLLERKDIILDPLAETLLFASDRAQHVAELIIPALKRGAYVISDRYYHSTLAYQGYGRGLDLKLLNQICNIAIQQQKPALTILLDLPPEAGLARAKGRGDKESWTKFEEEEINFHKRIREGFLELAALDSFLILDAAQKPEKLLELAWRAVIGKSK